MRLVPEMTYGETIAGPWGPTTGSPLGARLCQRGTSAGPATMRSSRESPAFVSALRTGGQTSFDDQYNRLD